MLRNPLLKLHLRLMGSWTSNLLVPALFVLVVIVGSAISYRMSPPMERGAVSAVWLGIVSGAQGVFMLILAAAMVRRAVLRDFQTGMIESHRQSPMSAELIILGYLTGPPILGALLYAVSLPIGSWFAAQYAASMSLPAAVVASGWYAFQLSLLSAALLVVSLVLLVALSTSGKANIIGVIVMVCSFGGWGVISIVPGLALVAGAANTTSLILNLARGVPKVDPRLLGVTLVAQLSLAAIFLRAACIKVRAPERAMFSIPLAYLLATAWGSILIIGLAYVGDVSAIVRRHATFGGAQLVGSTMAFVLIALVPLVAAARERFRYDVLRRFGTPAAMATAAVATITPLLLSVMASGLMAGMWWLLMRDEDPFVTRMAEPRKTLAAASIAVASLFIAMGAWVYITFAVGRKVVAPLLIALVIWLGLPLAIDAGYLAYLDSQGQQVSFTDGKVASLSPLGTLLLGVLPQGDPWRMLYGQPVLAVGLVLLAVRLRRRVLAAEVAALSGRIAPTTS